MIYIFEKNFLSFFLILLLGSSDASCSTSSLLKDNKDSNYSQHPCDSTNIQLVLADWKKDSLGCLKLRDQIMAKCLVQNLEIKGKTEREVIHLLGNPNRTKIKRVFLASEQEENDFIHLEYYFDVQCNERGELENSDRCWLEILIHPTTHKAIEVGYSCT